MTATITYANSNNDWIRLTGQFDSKLGRLSGTFTVN